MLISYMYCAVFGLELKSGKHVGESLGAASRSGAGWSNLCRAGSQRKETSPGNQVAELCTGAEGRFSIAKRLLVALSHVWMGLAEADDSGCLRLVGLNRNRPFVRVGA
jgi:hypothetical protein